MGKVLGEVLKDVGQQVIEIEAETQAESGDRSSLVRNRIQRGIDQAIVSLGEIESGNRQAAAEQAIQAGAQLVAAARAAIT